MADEIDRANEVTEKHMAMAMVAHTSVKREISEDCVECGGLIPEARQAATGGTDVCIGCAARIELQQKQFRRHGW